MKAKLALIVLCLFMLPAAVLAHGENEDAAADQAARREAAQEFRQELQANLMAELSEARAQRIVARCEALKTNVSQRSQRITGVQEARSQVVANLAMRLETFSARVQAAGLSVEALNEDVASLKTLSGELETLWTTYGESLTALSEAECDAEADDFHAALEAAKSAHTDIRVKYKEIKDFIQSEIKHDLEDLRAELVEASSGQ